MIEHGLNVRRDKDDEDTYCVHCGRQLSLWIVAEPPGYLWRDEGIHEHMCLAMLVRAAVEAGRR
jgi:hypothetical protein